jgi:hypothetical protein
MNLLGPILLLKLARNGDVLLRSESSHDLLAEQHNNHAALTPSAKGKMPPVVYLKTTNACGVIVSGSFRILNHGVTPEKYVAYQHLQHQLQQEQMRQQLQMHLPQQPLTLLGVLQSGKMSAYGEIFNFGTGGNNNRESNHSVNHSLSFGSKKIHADGNGVAPIHINSVAGSPVRCAKCNATNCVHMNSSSNPNSTRVRHNSSVSAHHHQGSVNSSHVSTPTTGNHLNIFSKNQLLRGLSQFISRKQTPRKAYISDPTIMNEYYNEPAIANNNALVSNNNNNNNNNINLFTGGAPVAAVVDADFSIAMQGVHILPVGSIVGMERLMVPDGENLVMASVLVSSSFLCYVMICSFDVIHRLLCSAAMVMALLAR